ncbi:MAG: LacI family transcriptional regulator [Clostridiales bacterium]|jgi:LacI family transcriptional regulator|nr:LacI family transcriptional regulator [Clostridiales bacterium]
MAVTIYDIAKEAKVSPSTVSRVLTSNAKVSPEKERAVRALIEKYNFQPNALAQGLSETQSRTIGLMVADIRNPYYAEVSVACEVAANKRGYKMFLSNARSNPELEVEILERFTSLRVDAIIQIGCRVDELESDPEYVKKVDNLSVPFVSTGVLDGSKRAYAFGIDSMAGIDLAFSHLLELGHEKIAFLGGWLRVRSTYQKWMRYIYLLGANGLPARTDYVQEGGYVFEAGVSCMRRLLALDDRPTAIIAVNDISATGAIAAIREEGLSVPEDFSIISHDNTLLSSVCVPLLTSVDYGYEKLGEGLVGTALRLAKHEIIPQETLLTPTLSVKNSCARPRKPVS